MIYLLAGLALWTLIHGLPIRYRNRRADLIQRLGAGPYKGLFSLAILVSVALMVIGWRSTGFEAVYDPPKLLMQAGVLVIVAAFLIGGGHAGNLRRVIRHPQLTSVALWGIGHGMVNGDLRSLVLFGGLGLWAVASIVLLNRRDPEWNKPERQSVLKDAFTVLLGFGLIYLVVHWLHVYLAGVDPLPMLHSLFS